MAERLLLCTDLDRTLLPNGPQPESPDAMLRLRQLVRHESVVLVYVTGRDQVLVENAIDEFRLPQPDYVIANVGSTIYQVEQGRWSHWQIWQQEISPDWNGLTHDEMHELFSAIPSLQLQEAAKQNEYKLSYYVSLDDDEQALMIKMQCILDRRAIRVNLIWSIDELAAIGLLDVLPAAASKRHAIEFLMAQLGFNHSNTIFAGDSGNDLAVLSSPINSVLVANASAEVRDEAQRLASDIGQAEALYFAHGGFLGMNGNYSAGILEGVAHYLPQTIKLMEGQI